MGFSNRPSLVLHQTKHHSGVEASGTLSQSTGDGASMTAQETTHQNQIEEGHSASLQPVPTVVSGETSSVLASGDETRNAIESIALIHFAHMQDAFSK